MRGIYAKIVEELFFVFDFFSIFPSNTFIEELKFNCLITDDIIGCIEYFTKKKKLKVICKVLLNKEDPVLYKLIEIFNKYKFFELANYVATRLIQENGKDFFPDQSDMTVINKFETNLLKLAEDEEKDNEDEYDEHKYYASKGNFVNVKRDKILWEVFRDFPNSQLDYLIVNLSLRHWLTDNEAEEINRETNFKKKLFKMRKILRVKSDDPIPVIKDIFLKFEWCESYNLLSAICESECEITETKKQNHIADDTNFNLDYNDVWDCTVQNY